MSDETMNTEEAAEFLHMSKSALLSKTGIPYSKPGKRRVYIKQDLIAYLRSITEQQIQLTTELIDEGRKCQSTKGEKAKSGKLNFLTVDAEYKNLLGL